MTKVFWTLDIFENNIGINHRCNMYLKESCELDFDHHFIFKYSSSNMKIPFVREISLKSSCSFGHHRH